jgi:predicted small metal-binding protein
VGLLLVATQLHMGVFSDPKNRWAALAQSTLIILATGFALSLSFLIPSLNSQVRGEIILGGAAFAIWRGIRIWWPVFRLRDRDRRHRFQRFPKPKAPGWHSSGLTRLRRDMKKRVECECGWVLETDDEEKLVKGVQEHASEVHHMQGVTRDQVLAQAKPA